MDIKARDIELMYELGALRFVPRMWRQFLNKDFANLAEHTLRVVWLAILIAKHEGVIDSGKVAKMALVHDLSESRAGDVHYLSRQYTDRHEDKAIQDVLKYTTLEDEFLELVEEYEKRESIDARIVKDADNLDVDFELREQLVRGYEIPEWQKMREFVYQNKLYTETAKRIWKLIQESNPHDWHNNANNRFKVGDWKKK